MGVLDFIHGWSQQPAQALPPLRLTPVPRAHQARDLRHEHGEAPQHRYTRSWPARPKKQRLKKTARSKRIGEASFTKVWPFNSKRINQSRSGEEDADLGFQKAVLGDLIISQARGNLEDGSYGTQKPKPSKLWNPETQANQTQEDAPETQAIKPSHGSYGTQKPQIDS